jgi:hypothetical protein
MKKYEVIAFEMLNEYYWSVYEVMSDQYIDTFHFKDDAEDLAYFLNQGGAFDGFTPSFILKPVPTIDVNAKFEQFMT